MNTATRIGFGLILFSPWVWGQYSIRWFYLRNGNEIHPYDEAASVAVQGDRVFVTGYLDNKYTWRDLYTICLDANTGTPIWENLRAENEHDRGRDVKIRNNYLYVGGSASTDTCKGCFSILRYDTANGNILWFSQARGQASYYSYGGGANSIVIGDSGEVYAVGYQTYLRDTTYASGPFAAKFSSEGQVLWRFDPGLSRGNNMLYKVILGLDGKVYAAGKYNDDFLIIRFNPETGQEVWRYQKDWEAHEDRATDLVIYGGYLYAVGTVWGSDFRFNCFVVKLDPSNGNPVWVKHFGAAAYYDYLYSVVAGPEGLYVGGYTGTPMGAAALLAKIDSGTGDTVWTTRVQHCENCWEYFKNLLLAPGGVYGSVNLSVSGSNRFYLYKFDSYGWIVWKAEFKWGDDNDCVNNIITGSPGDIYLAGMAGINRGDYLALKIRDFTDVEETAEPGTPGIKTFLVPGGFFMETGTPGHLEIFDPAGRLVESRELIGRQFFRLNPGVYILRFSSGKETKTMKTISVR